MGISYGGLKSTDQYYNSTVLLLTGDDAPNGAQNNTFVDSSSNNFAITRNGNTTQGSFSPFSVPEGHWSNYFDLTGDYLTVPAGSAFAYGTGDFTVEGWFNCPSLPAYIANLFSQTFSGTNYFVCALGDNTTPTPARKVCFIFATSGGGTIVLSGPTLFEFNTWNHFAIVRSAGSVTCYLNGVGGTPVSCTQDFTNTALVPTIGRYTHLDGGWNFTGYLSNLRVVKGTAVYTANFTPPTAPLTAITNTSLLTCQSNRFKDNSTNNFAITRNGDVSVQPFSPLNQTPAMQSTGWSHYFDGSGDYLSAPGNNAWVFAGDFTMECWFNITGESPLDANTSRPFVLFRNGVQGFIAFQFMVGGSSTTTGTSLGIFRSNDINYSVSYTFSKNVWYHVALVRSSNVCTYYVNGVAQGTPTTISGSIGSASYTMEVGGSAQASYPNTLFGYMTNARIVNGTAIYTSNFNPPFAPLTRVTNTSLLICQNQTFNDASTNNFTITRAGNVTPSTLSPFKALTNYSPTIQGGSGYYDGTGDYLTVGGGLPSGQGTEFTLECWVYVTSLANYRAITRGTAGGSLDFGITSTGQLQLDNTGVANIFQSSAGVITTNQWYHIALTRTTGNLYTGYVNGVSVASGTNSTSMSANTTIGYSSFSASHLFMGHIVDFRVTTTRVYTANFTPPTAPLTAITNTSLLLNFTNAGIVDYTANNIVETVGDAQINTSVVKYGTGSLYFDGTGDYLSAPTSPNFEFGTGDFTVECWAYSQKASPDGGIVRAPNASGYSGWGLVFGNQANKFTFVISYNGSTWAFIIHSTNTFAINTWHHVALVRSGSTITMYVNGNSEGTANVSTNSLYGGSNPLFVGFDRFSYFQGYMCDLRITKGVARYTSNFRPPNKLPRVRIT